MNDVKDFPKDQVLYNKIPDSDKKVKPNNSLLYCPHWGCNGNGVKALYFNVCNNCPFSFEINFNYLYFESKEQQLKVLDEYFLQAAIDAKVNVAKKIWQMGGKSINSVACRFTYKHCFEGLEWALSQGATMFDIISNSYDKVYTDKHIADKLLEIINKAKQRHLLKNSSVNK